MLNLWGTCRKASCPPRHPTRVQNKEVHSLLCVMFSISCVVWVVIALF